MAASTTGIGDPVETTRGFLVALERGELGPAIDLLHEDAVWINVSLPAVHGRDRLERALHVIDRTVDFHVHFEHLAVADDDESVVLTERIDGISIGPFFWQFWVYGRFEVRGGKITVWRDSFDWADLIVGATRGALGVLIPSIRRRWPSG